MKDGEEKEVLNLNIVVEDRNGTFDFEITDAKEAGSQDWEFLKSAFCAAPCRTDVSIKCHI